MKRKYFFLIAYVLCCVSMYAQGDDMVFQHADNKIDQIKHKKWRLGIQNAFSFMSANTGYYEVELIPEGLESNTLKDFFNENRKCFTLSTDVHRIFSNIWGIGIKYSFLSNCNREFMTFHSNDGVGIVSTDITNRLYINYIGASAFAKIPLSQANSLFLNTNFSLGYTRYHNEFETGFHSQYFSANTLSTGNAIGGNVGLGLEYHISSILSISFGTEYFISIFDHMSVKRGIDPKQKISFEGDDKRNVSHIDIYIGFRIHL